MVVGYSRIGDAAMVLPAISALKLRFPDAEIVVNTEFPSSQIFDCCPHVDRTVVRKTTLWSCFLAGRRAGKVDLYINFHTMNNANRWAYLARIPVRIGMNSPKTKQMLTNVVEWPEGGLTIFESGKQILQLLGGPGFSNEADFALPESAREEASSALARCEMLGKAFIAVNVGASSAFKCWPLERFHEVVLRIQQKGIPVVLVGGRFEAELLSRHREWSEFGLVNLTGKLSILGSAAVLEQAKLLVTNDSGLMHLSGLVGTPTFALYGFAFGKVAPFGVGHIGICGTCACDNRKESTCDGTCIRSITLETAWGQLDRQLSGILSSH